MTKMIKMNRNRQINLPSSFVGKLSLGEGHYFKADLKGNQIVLTPVDVVERSFSDEDLDLVEKAYQRERGKGEKVTREWIKRLTAGTGRAV